MGMIALRETWQELREIAKEITIQTRDGDQISLYDSLNDYLSRYSLTERESEILFAISYLGGTNEEVGHFLNISPNTVRNHVSKILLKMKVKSIREAQALILRFMIKAYKTC